MPISRLPEETLLNIFTLCAGFRDDLEELDLLYSNVVTWDWISITHVCAHWRNLSISSPTLWQAPSLAIHSRARLTKFLDRSKSVPLTIRAPYKCKPSSSGPGKCKKCRDNVIMLLQHLHRIRRLTVRCMDILIRNTILEKSAPILEELDITNVDQPFLLPHNFLTSAPLLKILQLSGFYLPFSSHLLRGLNSISIRDSNLDYPSIRSSRFHHTVHEFLEVLCLSPTIQELSLVTIRDSHRKDSDHRSFEELIIELASLKSFEIQKMDISACETLLQYVKFPALADLTIGLRHTDVNDFSRILSVLTQITEHKVCTCLEVLFMNDEVSVISKPSFESDSSRIEVGRGRTTLSLYWHGRDGRHLDDEDFPYEELAVMTGDLIRGSYWRNATSLTLEVDTEYALDVHKWEMLLKSLEHLEELCLRTEELTPMYPAQPEEVILLENNIISALFMHSNSAADEVVSEEPRSSVILPRLTGLILFVSSIEHISERLLQCVKARKEHGLPVHDLAVDILGKPSYGFKEWNAGWCMEVRKFVSQFGHAADLE